MAAAHDLRSFGGFMDSFQLNKIIGAVLGTVFVVFSVAIVSNALFSAHAPEQFGFAIEAEEPEAGGSAPADTGPEPVSPLLASADVAAGEAVFRRCAACHTVDAGGPNRVGPNLWNVVGRQVAAVADFNYSAAMRQEAESGNPVWDYEHLNAFLLSPRRTVPGTSMGFAGLPKLQDRANLIAYLREQADSPAPLPSADAAGDDAAGDDAAGGDAASGDAAPADSAGDDAADGAEVTPATEPAGDAADDGAAGDDAAAPEDAAPAEPAQEPAEETSTPADSGDADQGGAPAAPAAETPGADTDGEEAEEEILPQQ